MVRQFHDVMFARCVDDSMTSEPYPVSNGVKQGCVLAPTLFIMMCSAMSSDAFDGKSANIPFRSELMASSLI
jgi:hypothetical protein